MYFDIDYRRLRANDSVVVYGCGKYGKYIAEKMKKRIHVSVVAFIDKNYLNKCDYLEDIPILGVDSIAQYKGCMFVIAISNKQAAKEAKMELIEKGISKEKIIEGEYYDLESRIDYFELIKFLERIVTDNEPNIYILMLPEHGNTGDYLIGYAEQLFLKTFFPKANVHGITTLEWQNLKDILIRIINEGDLICINGGGFFGNLRGDDAVYKDIIESFPNNKKIFFPNTLTYDRKGEEQTFLEDVKWLDKQGALHLFFRDKNSYLKMKEYYKYSYLAPDMALLIDTKRRCVPKNGRVLLCLRDDCERVVDIRHIVEKQLDKAQKEYDFFDIYIDEYVSQNDGRKLVKYVIEKFMEYECIVTDRLHGMIIAAIASVPCLAFDNTTKKISGVYEWIKGYEYIKMLNYKDVERLDLFLNDVCDEKKWKEYIPPLAEFYQMAKIIRTIVECDLT